MKKALRMFTLLLIVVFTFVSCQQDPVVQIQQSPTIRGSVSIPEGSGLTGRDFFIRVMEGERAVFTGRVGSDCSFSVPGLKEDVSYNILLTTEEPGDIKGSERDASRATTSGYGGWLSNVSASINEQAGVGSVKVKPLGTIRGVVKKDGAEDNYDTTVYIPGTSYLAMTDGEGNFSIFNVPQATYTLRFISSGYMARMVDNVVLHSDSDTENPVITLQTQTLIQNAGNVEGYAIFDEGSDSTGISIKLESYDGAQNYAQFTADNGFYRFTGVLPGRYRVVASYANYPSQVSEYFDVAAALTSIVSDKLILLENIGTVTGSASLSDDVNVTSGISILFEGIDNGRTYSSITGEKGTFTKAVKPGSYRVTASYAGYSSQSQNVYVPQNGTVNVVIPSLFMADGAVSGKVVLEGAIDAGGAIVTLTSASDPNIKANAITDVDGSFSIFGLKNDGQYYVTVTKDGYVKNTSFMADVSLGTVYNIPAISLKSLVSNVKGKIVLDDGETVDYTGINVMLRSDDGSLQYDATTDQQGSYVMNNVLPGHYVLYASKAGYVDKSVRNIVVESAVDKDLETVILQVGVRSVTGKVKLELRDDNAGALITATSLADENLVYSAITNSDGNYTLSGMKPGEYSIVISCANYRTTTLRTINVVESVTLDLPLSEIEIARGIISGVATLEGRTNSEGILVEVIGTDFSTFTNENGEYRLYVPEGNYAGLRFSCEDYKTSSKSLVISLFADNTFPIENIELEATHVSIFGSVVVSGADDNKNVSVSFDDYSTERIVTKEDGSFQFDHIPVGTTYTLRFERENTADITVRVEAKACDGILVKDVVMVPDAAGIEGKVRLDDGLNNGNVRVSINTGSDILSTTTNYAGMYYIGGIPTGKELTVEYSKDGWESATQTIASLTPLEVRGLDEITLSDISAPTLRSVEINGGANVTGSRLVNVSLDAEDKGSGLNEMRYYWNDDNAAAWILYSKNFKIELPDSSNGFYKLTVEVRDNAGNVCLASASDSIELVGQITTIQPGILSGDNLHWQAKDNPIVIMGTVTVPQNETLIIDPGVDVIFNGEYSIRVLGKIQAIGTESQPIVFDSSKNYLEENYQVEGFEGYDGYWGGIIVSSDIFSVTDNGNYNYTFNDGSILSYCNIYDLSEGVTGKVFVDHCRIETLKSAVGKYRDGNRFNGYLLNSCISGGVAVNDNWNNYAIYGNVFDGTDLLDEPVFEYENHYFSYYDDQVSSVWYEYEWDSDGNHRSRDISEFDFNGIRLEDGYSFVNNKVIGYNAIMLNPGRQLQFNTFESCRSIKLINDDGNDYFRYNDFHDITDTIRFAGDRPFTFNNMYNMASDYVITVESNNSTLDYGFNYWGDHSSELQSIVNYGSGNASFVYDGYCSTNLSIIDWSDFVSEPWDFVGFQGQNLFPLNATFIQEVSGYNEAKVGNPVNIKLSTSGTANIAYYRIGQTYEELTNATFQPYYGVCTYEADDIDIGKLSNGILTLYVQAKTDTGTVSPTSLVSVGYDKPYAYDIKLQNGTLLDGLTLKENSAISWQWSIHNASSGTNSDINFKFYLDGRLITNENWGIDNNWTGYNTGWIDLSEMKNGAHTIRFDVADRVGDSTTTEVTFNVQHPTAEATDISLESGTEVAEGQALEFSVQTNYSTKLKEIRVYSNDYLLSAKSFSGVSSYLLKTDFSIENQYLKAGDHVLYIEVETNTGDISRSKGIPFSVAGTVGEGPEITVVSISNGNTITGTGTVTVNASSDKGVRSLYIKADGKTLGSNEGKYLTYGSEYNQRTLQTSFSVYQLTNGEHEIEIVVYDFAGVATTETRTIVVDKKFPSTNVSVTERQETFTVNVSVNDVTNIGFATVYLGEEEIGRYDVTGQTGRWTKEIAERKNGFADGVHEITVVIQDLVGDTSRTVSKDVITIDSTKVFVENNLEGLVTFSGMLADDAQLHWTESMNPVVITGDLIVAAGKTLVIDPGVEVYFDGDYSVSVRGTLDARGTDEKPIVFRSSASNIENHEGHYGTWKGITFAGDVNVSIVDYTCTFNSGSIMGHCIVRDLSDGIVGRVYIESCEIESSNYALGNVNSNFSGVLVDNEIHGIVRLEDNRFVFGNEFHGDTIQETSDYGLGFRWYKWDDAFFVNNLVSEYRKVHICPNYRGVFKFNTLSLIESLEFHADNPYADIQYNEIDSISGSMLISGNIKSMRFSNFIGLTENTQISTNTSWETAPSIDMSSNYWGGENTSELEGLTGSNRNASFISDGYDNTDYTVIDWNGYVNEPLEFAGYQGKGFFSAKASLVQSVSGVNEIENGSPIQVRISMQAGGSIAEYRVAQSLSELLDSAWHAYSGDLYISDYEISETGKIDLLVQVRTIDGTTSPIMSVDVSSDIPKVTSTTIADGQVISDDVVRFFYATIYDASNSVRHRTFVDGVRKYDGGYGFLDSGTYAVLGGYPWWGDNDCYLNGAVIDPTQFKNGEHTITIMLDDMVGNQSETAIHFTVERSLPSLLNIEFPNGTELDSNTSLNIDFAVTDASHLKEIRVISDGYCLVSKDYVDNGSVTIRESITLSTNYLQSGAHELYLEFEDYAGNISRSDVYAFSVDTVDVSPTISGFEVVDNQTFSDYSTIEWNLVFHADKGVKTANVTLGDYNVFTLSEDAYYDGSEDANATVRFRVPYYKNGAYELKVTVSDFAGNTTTETRTVFIEKALPEITVTASDNSTEYAFGIGLSSASWMRDMALMIDDIELHWWNINSTGYSGDRNDSWSVIKKELPVGTHAVKAVVRSQAGEIIQSEPVEITIEKATGSENYGVNKTWNENGTLSKDGKTRFLWSFDSGTGLETVRDKTFGNVEKSVAGIGGAQAAKFYVDMTGGLTFGDSKWTIEYWSKNDSDVASSGLTLELNSFFRSGIRKNGSFDDSYLDGQVFYTDVEGVLCEYWYNEGRTSRANISDWHHYAFVSDGNCIKMYVDGVLVYKTADDHVAPTKMTRIYCGMDENVYIDELRISAIARSEQELWDYVQYVRGNNLIPE